ncbi:hypothetical protein C8F04DRAFT_1187330 [Mycena alexandri]|uniref:Uncharacterized protein n=1 Tax=Mycena alexandri TaxID=1745969 RepID=A0AAD6SLM2_9AGAR|nr:hypothetical protein C8F04DRAFT_1187330 [Mycena alexandri]
MSWTPATAHTSPTPVTAPTPPATDASLTPPRPRPPTSTATTSAPARATTASTHPLRMRGTATPMPASQIEGAPTSTVSAPTLDDRFSLKEYDDHRPREERDDRRPYAADAHPRMDLTQLVPKKPAKRVRADDDEAAGPSNKRRNTSESHGLGAEAVQQQSEDLGEDNARGSKRPREESDEAEVLPWPGEGETKSQDEMDTDPDDKKRWRMSTDFYATHFVAKRHPTTADDHTFTVDPNNPDTWIRMPQRIGNGMNARGKQWDFEWSWTLAMVFEFSLDVTSPTFLFGTRALVGRFRKHNENGEG